jgi:hypothetical protein
MPKSKTRKGKGKGGSTFAKGHDAGVRHAVMALIDDLPPEVVGEETCPGCILEGEGFYNLSELARIAFHVDQSQGRAMRAVSTR